MVRGWVALAVVLAAVGLASLPAAAEIFPVPDTVRRMSLPYEETHVLRAPDETVLGEQRSRAVVEGDKLVVDCWTKFTSGESWDERAVMDLANGYRAISCRKTGRMNGAVTAEQTIDFTTGDVRWLADGAHQSAKVAFEPDT